MFKYAKMLFSKNKKITNTIDIEIPKIENQKVLINNNTFVVFKSINDILCLIYSNDFRSIISYNLIDNKIINVIKNAHEEYIINFRYYSDKNNKRDLILSIDGCNDIKIWDIFNCECILSIFEVYTKGRLFSACFLNDNNQIYILTSKGIFGDESLEPIKVFNLNGNKIKEINDSNDKTHFIDTYYDKTSYKNYIITGNRGYAKSYDYNKNKVYHIYNDNKNYLNMDYKNYYSFNEEHNSIIINNNEEIIKLIDSSFDKYIRIWNFHSGQLLKKINAFFSINSIVLWNNNYLFIGCSNKSIKIIDLKYEKIVKELYGHNSKVNSVKRIYHPQYGDCLISQGYRYGKIILWVNEKYQNINMQ